MLEFAHLLPEAPIVAGRHPFIVASCRGKSVLHVGCVDAGLLEQRFARGELLHQQLAAVAVELWGTDVDLQGISFLRERGFAHLYAVDLATTSPPADLAGTRFDVIVLSEVLEHLANPGEMLESMKRFMIPAHSRLLVTVPNAFALSTLEGLFDGVEHVHPDHHYYFSHTTLGTLLRKVRLRIIEECVYIFDLDRLPARRWKQVKAFSRDDTPAGRHTYSSLRRLLGRLRHLGIRGVPGEILRTFVSAILYARTPFWADGLIAVCVWDGDSSLSNTDRAV